MSVIALRVTTAELAHLASGNVEQRQIALKGVSEDLSGPLTEITRNNRRKLTLGGCFEFVLGDRSALWRAHNQAAAEDFDALFELLALRPDREFRCLCSIE